MVRHQNPNLLMILCCKNLVYSPPKNAEFFVCLQVWGTFLDRKFCPQNPPGVVMGIQISPKNGVPQNPIIILQSFDWQFCSSFPDQAARERSRVTVFCFPLDDELTKPR